MRFNQEVNLKVSFTLANTATTKRLMKKETPKAMAAMKGRKEALLIVKNIHFTTSKKAGTSRRINSCFILRVILYKLLQLRLHDAIHQLPFYSNSLIHILSLSNSHSNVASLQINWGDKSHRVIVAYVHSKR